MCTNGCEGENTPRLCELVDPANKAFNRKYIGFLQERASPAPKTKPGIMTKALNYGKALAKHAVNRFGHADKATQDQRLAICRACDLRIEDQCGSCGCPLAKKTSWASESCPVGLWEAVASKPDCPNC